MPLLFVIADRSVSSMNKIEHVQGKKYLGLDCGCCYRLGNGNEIIEKTRCLRHEIEILLNKNKAHHHDSIRI